MWWNLFENCCQKWERSRADGRQIVCTIITGTAEKTRREILQKKCKKKKETDKM
jgi:hypothetical protein